LDLVDHCPSPQPSDEPLWIAGRQRSDRLVVECQVVGGQPVDGEHPRQRALAGLTRAEQRNDPRLAHGLHHGAGQTSIDELHCCGPPSASLEKHSC